MGSNFTDAVTKLKKDELTPKLKIPSFGKDERSTQIYNDFRKSFINYVKDIETDSKRLELLKDTLTGPTQTLVIDLDIFDEN